MTVTIYGSATSTCTKRVLVTCHEIGVEYKVVPVDLMKLEHKDPVWIETMNPFGAIPVLVDADGTQIYESRAIARYLVAKYSPNSSLLPSPTNPKAYGLFEQAESIEYSSFDPPAIAIYEEQIWAWIEKRDVNVELIEKYRKTLLNRLEGYDQILSKQKYLAGDNITLADLFHLPYGTVLEKYQPGLLATQPNVKRWWDDITARESWKAVPQELM